MRDRGSVMILGERGWLGCVLWWGRGRGFSELLAVVVSMALRVVIGRGI